jgi:hypothetical protein
MVIVAAATLSQDGQLVSLGSMCVVRTPYYVVNRGPVASDLPSIKWHVQTLIPPYFSLVTVRSTRIWRGGGGGPAPHYVRVKLHANVRG